MNGYKTAMDILDLLNMRPPENDQEQEIQWLKDNGHDWTRFTTK